MGLLLYGNKLELWNCLRRRNAFSGFYIVLSWKCCKKCGAICLSKYCLMEAQFAEPCLQSVVLKVTHQCNVNICWKFTAFATWRHKNEEQNFMEPATVCFSFRQPFMYIYLLLPELYHLMCFSTTKTKVQLFLSLWRTVLHIFLRDMVTVSQHVEELSVEQIMFVN